MSDVCDYCGNDVDESDYLGLICHKVQLGLYFCHEHCLVAWVREKAEQGLLHLLHEDPKVH